MESNRIMDNQLNNQFNIEQSVRLQQSLSLMLIPIIAMLALSLGRCSGGAIPAFVFWILAGIAFAAALAGIILAACEQLGGVNCLIAALILQIVCAGLMVVQMIVGTIAFALQ